MWGSRPCGDRSTRPEIAQSRDWIYDFTPDEIDEIEAALRSAKARGNTMATLTQNDFPLPTVAKRIEVARDHLENRAGCGTGNRLHGSNFIGKFGIVR